MKEHGINFKRDLQKLLNTENGKRAVAFYENGYITLQETLELLKRERAQQLIQELRKGTNA